MWKISKSSYTGEVLSDIRVSFKSKQYRMDSSNNA